MCPFVLLYICQDTISSHEDILTKIDLSRNQVFDQQTESRLDREARVRRGQQQ